jgi:hypothetical protein
VIFGIIHANGNDEIMACAMTKTRIQSDILEWHVPEEVLAVLLKDRSTVLVLNWETGQPIVFRSIVENGGGHG